MVMDLNLTGEQYLTFTAAQYGKDSRAERQRLADILQANLAVKIGNYSRGNRQKIGLIAALQHRPELLILDEPTSGFDPLVQEKFAELIREYVAAGGDYRDWRPDWNIAPTDTVPVIRSRNDRRELAAVRWGAVSPSSPTFGGGKPIINARVETVATNGMFRQIRIGRHGQPFTVWKIRTMRVVRDAASTVTSS